MTRVRHGTSTNGLRESYRIITSGKKITLHDDIANRYSFNKPTPRPHFRGKEPDTPAAVPISRQPKLPIDKPQDMSPPLGFCRARAPVPGAGGDKRPAAIHTPMAVDQDSRMLPSPQLNPLNPGKLRESPFHSMLRGPSGASVQATSATFTGCSAARTATTQEERQDPMGPNHPTPGQKRFQISHFD